jgi:hypothetical protein
MHPNVLKRTGGSSAKCLDRGSQSLLTQIIRYSQVTQQILLKFRTPCTTQVNSMPDSFDKANILLLEKQRSHYRGIAISFKLQQIQAFGYIAG